MKNLSKLTILLLVLVLLAACGPTEAPPRAHRTGGRTAHQRTGSHGSASAH
jgi:predicted small lipoprotein YifL